MSKPTIRWGILGTGSTSTSFVTDLVMPRPSAKANHIIAAIGTSSTAKGESFVKKTFEKADSAAPRPKIYTDYAGVYADPTVDAVYVGTPHTVHKQNCLDAIAAGKHVLCEKPFTVNAAQAEEVFAAAREKGVFIMEAVWTRFFPLVQQLQARLHDVHAPLLGALHRSWCDFGIAFDFDSIPPDSRLRDRNLGAGALLDMGIYPITMARVLLGGPIGDGERKEPVVSSELVLNEDGIDIMDAVVLRYANPPRLAMLSASMLERTPAAVMRIEGAKGYVVVEGHAASYPLRAIISLNGKEKEEPEVLEPKHEGTGLYFEADAVALDLAAGRTENEVVPWGETMRVMRLMDGVRERAGLRYPQDG